MEGKPSKLNNLKDYLAKYPSLSVESGKVKCSLTGHEVKETNLEGLQQYLRGSKYIKAKQWYSRDFENYLRDENLIHAKEFLVPHKSSDKLLFCTLTRRVVNRIPKKIIAHLVSPRFGRYVEAHRRGVKLGGKPKVAIPEEGEEVVPEVGEEESDEEEEEEDEKEEEEEKEDDKQEEVEMDEGMDEISEHGDGGKNKGSGKRASVKIPQIVAPAQQKRRKTDKNN